jgi:hypothetical protein
MGVDEKAGPIGLTAEDLTSFGGAPGPTTAESPALFLSALLASEDLLFRDPFADFTPSSR